MNTEVHFSSGKDDWETPDDLFAQYDAQYHFVLDAAANQDNHKLHRWFGPGGEQEDALTCDWPIERGNIWLNPPYSRGLQRKFVEKAIGQFWQPTNHNEWTRRFRRTSIVCLLPADTSTRLFHELVKPLGEITFLPRRLRFKGAPGKARFASMIVVFE